MSQPKNIDKKILSNRNKALVELSGALNNLQIPFMLSDGVLLGAVRDGDFIPWDWDVEISIKVEDIFHKSDLILELLKDQDFILGTVNLKWDNYKINIHKYGSKFSMIGFYSQDGFRLRSAWKYPEVFFDKLESIDFLGSQYLAPSPPEDYLEYQYGDWKTPIRETTKRKYLTSQVYVHNGLRTRIGSVFNLKIQKYLLLFKQIVRKYYIDIDRESIFQIMYNSCVSNVKNLNIIEIGTSDGREACLALRDMSDQINSINIFEPDLNNYKTSKRNIEKYDKLNKTRYHNVAVGISSKTEYFYLSSKASNLNSSISSNQSQKKIRIKYLSLLEILQTNEIKRPVMIKMDIEGFEVDLLNSVIDYLLHARDIYILLEVHPNTYSKNRDMFKILDTLFNNGYFPIMLESAGLKVPKLYKDNDMTPIFESRTRALYSFPDKNFTKLVCSKNICDYVNKEFLTPKIARSLLITNSNKKFSHTFNVNNYIH
jgi:FkbM family methyltransferase